MRGLVAEAPLGDATQGSHGNAGIYSGAAALATTSAFQMSQDTLFALAEDTGGKALFGIDRFSPGEYDCQVTVLDPATQKSAFWRAPIMLVP